jgi:hypothetical protein
MLEWVLQLRLGTGEAQSLHPKPASSRIDLFSCSSPDDAKIVPPGG